MVVILDFGLSRDLIHLRMLAEHRVAERIAAVTGLDIFWARSARTR